MREQHLDEDSATTGCDAWPWTGEPWPPWPPGCWKPTSRCCARPEPQGLSFTTTPIAPAAPGGTLLPGRAMRARSAIKPDHGVLHRISANPRPQLPTPPRGHQCAACGARLCAARPDEGGFLTYLPLAQRVLTRGAEGLQRRGHRNGPGTAPAPAGQRRPPCCTRTWAWWRRFLPSFFASSLNFFLELSPCLIGKARSVACCFRWRRCCHLATLQFVWLRRPVAPGSDKPEKEEVRIGLTDCASVVMASELGDSTRGTA